MIAGDVIQTGGHCAEVQQFPNARRRAAINALLNGRWRLAGNGTRGCLGEDEVAFSERQVIGFMVDHYTTTRS